MAKTILGRSVAALSAANMAMRDLLDIGGVPDNSALDRRVHAAIQDLFESIEEIKEQASPRHRERLAERGPVVFPAPGKDMRYWRMSNGRKASVLLKGRRASRLANARKVVASPSHNYYRPMTARQYLEVLEDAIITDRPKTVVPSRTSSYVPNLVVI